MTWRSSRQQTCFQLNLLLEIFVWYWFTLTELLGVVVNLQRWVFEALYQSTICIAVCHNFRYTICKLVIFLCLILYLYLVAIHVRTAYDLFTFHIKQTNRTQQHKQKKVLHTVETRILCQKLFFNTVALRKLLSSVIKIEDGPIQPY